MKITTHRAVGTLAVSATALMLAACGSSSSGSSSSSGTSASTSAGTSASASAGTSAAAPSSAAASAISIAGVYGNSGDPFWASVGCGAQQEAAKLGVQYKAFAAANLDTAAFSQNFSSATTTKPSGIFVNPANPNQFVTQYQQLMAAGTPIVTINGSTPPAQYKVVGTDTKDTAFLNDVKALVPAGTSGKMFIVNGIPGLVPVDVRLNPVVEAITGASPSLTKLPVSYSTFDVNKATSAVSSAIIANPDLKVIVAADGPDGQGAAAAVKAAGKAGKITVIALDATPPEVAALKDGTISGLVAQAPSQIGAQQVKTLVDYLQAHAGAGAVTASADFIGVPQKLLTKTNVDSADSADWVYKSSCS